MAFTGKVALITGAASGMGKISALRLAKQGATVVALDRDEEMLQELSKESNNIKGYVCDIADREQVEKIVTDVAATHGSIDRLTHAAAIMPTEQLSKMPVDDIIKIHTINYYGTVYIVKAVLPHMLQRNSGDIILFGSIAGFVLCPDMGAYSASKAAVNIFGEQLIRETEDSGLRILLVKPPATNTPLIKQSLETSAPAPLRLGMEQNRFADPQTIVDAIEKGIDSGKSVLYPTSGAKILTWLQFLAPKWMWNMTVSSGKKAAKK